MQGGIEVERKDGRTKGGRKGGIEGGRKGGSKDGRGRERMERKGG